MSLYVEILIRAPMDALWTYTQTPTLHQQWDLRFSKIDYEPRFDDGSPQRFRYATRIGFGLAVSGEGEATGHRELPDGSSISALKFASDAPLSIIREGSGYWKYVPTRDGVRFLTWYDYRTRFGPAGALFDHIVFRPLIGGATAWSFDRLRLWIEERLDPRLAVRQTLVHVTARVALAIVFAYQGVVPKLLTRHVDETAMLTAAGLPARMAAPAVTCLGLAELALAAVLLVSWSRPWPVWVCLFAMPVATIAVAISSPGFFEAAFNPLSLNVSVAAIAAMDLLVMGTVPSAGRCRRRPAAGKK
jgi:hypothetical protein